MEKQNISNWKIDENVSVSSNILKFRFHTPTNKFFLSAHNLHVFCSKWYSIEEELCEYRFKGFNYMLLMA